MKKQIHMKNWTRKVDYQMVVWSIHAQGPQNVDISYHNS